MLEIGAFPFLLKKDKVHIMLIKTLSGDSWILPKGQPEKNLTKSQVAKLECYEEAGVQGKVYNNGEQKEFKRESGGSIIIFPLQIKKTLQNWPEKHIRKRRLVTIKEALSLVRKKEHLKAIEYFSKSQTLTKNIKSQ